MAFHAVSLPSASRTVAALRRDEQRHLLRSQTTQEEREFGEDDQSYKLPRSAGGKIWALGRILVESMPKRVRQDHRKEAETLKLNRNFVNLSEAEREFVSGLLRSEDLMKVSLSILRSFQEALFDDEEELVNKRELLMDAISDGLHQVKVSTARICYTKSVGPQRTELSDMRQQHRTLQAEFCQCRATYLKEVMYLRDQARARADPELSLDQGMDIAHFYDPTWALDHMELKFVTEVVHEKLKMIFERNPSMQAECDLPKLEQMMERVRGGEVRELKASLQRVKQDLEGWRQECMELREKVGDPQVHKIQASLPQKYWSEAMRENMLTRLELQAEEEHRTLLKEQFEHKKDVKELAGYREENAALQKAYEEELAENSVLHKRVLELEEQLDQKINALREVPKLKQALSSKSVQTSELNKTMQRQIGTLRAIASVHREYLAPNMAMAAGDFTFADSIDDDQAFGAMESVFSHRSTDGARTASYVTHRSTGTDYAIQHESEAEPGKDCVATSEGSSSSRLKKEIKTSIRQGVTEGAEKMTKIDDKAPQKFSLRDREEQEEAKYRKLAGRSATSPLHDFADADAKDIEEVTRTWPLMGASSSDLAVRLDGHSFMDLLETAEACAVESQERLANVQARSDELQAQNDELRWLLQRQLNHELQGNAEAELAEAGHLCDMAKKMLGSPAEPTNGSVARAAAFSRDAGAASVGRTIATAATAAAATTAAAAAASSLPQTPGDDRGAGDADLLSNKASTMISSGVVAASSSHGGTGDVAVLSTTASTTLSGEGFGATSGAVAVSGSHGGTGDVALLPARGSPALSGEGLGVTSGAAAGGVSHGGTGEAPSTAIQDSKCLDASGSSSAAESARYAAANSTTDPVPAVPSGGGTGYTDIPGGSLAAESARSAAVGSGAVRTKPASVAGGTGYAEVLVGTNTAGDARSAAVGSAAVWTEAEPVAGGARYANVPVGGKAAESARSAAVGSAAVWTEAESTVGGIGYADVPVGGNAAEWARSAAVASGAVRTEAESVAGGIQYADVKCKTCKICKAAEKCKMCKICTDNKVAESARSAAAGKSAFRTTAPGARGGGYGGVLRGSNAAESARSTAVGNSTVPTQAAFGVGEAADQGVRVQDVQSAIPTSSPEGLKALWQQVEEVRGEHAHQLHEALQRLEKSKKASSAGNGKGNHEEAVARLQQVEELTRKIKQCRFEQQQVEARLGVAQWGQWTETEQGAQLGDGNAPRDIARQMTPEEELEASRHRESAMRSLCHSLSRKLEESVAQNMSLIVSFNDMQTQASAAAEALEALPHWAKTPEGKELRANLNKICCGSIYDRLHSGKSTARDRWLARRKKLREDCLQALYPTLKIDPDFADTGATERRMSQEKTRSRSSSQGSSQAKQSAVEAKKRSSGPEDGGSPRARIGSSSGSLTKGRPRASSVDLGSLSIRQGSSSRPRSPSPDWGQGLYPGDVDAASVFPTSPPSEPPTHRKHRTNRKRSQDEVNPQSVVVETVAAAAGSQQSHTKHEQHELKSPEVGCVENASNMGASPMSETAREINSSTQACISASISAGLTEPPALVDDHHHKKGRPASASQAVDKLPPLEITSSTRRPNSATPLHTVDLNVDVAADTPHLIHVATPPRGTRRGGSAPMPPTEPRPHRPGSRPGSAVLIGQGSQVLDRAQSSSAAERKTSVGKDYCPVGHYHEVPLVGLPKGDTVRRRESNFSKERCNLPDEAKKGELKRRNVPSPPHLSRDKELGLSGKKLAAQPDI